MRGWNILYPTLVGTKVVGPQTGHFTHICRWATYWSWYIFKKMQHFFLHMQFCFLLSCLWASLYSIIVCLQVNVYKIIRNTHETVCIWICVYEYMCQLGWGGGSKHLVTSWRGVNIFWIHLGGSNVLYMSYWAPCHPNLIINEWSLTVNSRVWRKAATH